MSPVKKNKPTARAARAPRRESPSAMPKSSTSVSPERVKFEAERSRFSTPRDARDVMETVEYLSDPTSIYSSPSKRGDTASKYARRPCGHRSVLSDRMSESPARSGMSSPSMGWSRVAHTGHSSNSTLFKREMSLDSRRNSSSEYAGSEASSSSSGNGMDFDIDLDIDIVMSSSNPRINIQQSRTEPRRPKRGADEFDSLADMMRGLDVGRKRSRHDEQLEQLEPRFYQAKIEFMDHKVRTIKQVPKGMMPRRVSSSNILAKCIGIPAHAKPIVEKDRSKLRRRQNEE